MIACLRWRFNSISGVDKPVRQGGGALSACRIPPIVGVLTRTGSLVGSGAPLLDGGGDHGVPLSIRTSPVSDPGLDKF